MSYVLETIPDQDMQKIVADASASIGADHIFGYRRMLVIDCSNMRWAIDRTSDTYLFREHSFAREVENEYSFFYKKTMYTVRVSSSWLPSKPTTIWFRHKQIFPVPSEMQIALTEAFALYGIFGSLPNTAGATRPSNAVAPLFCASNTLHGASSL